MLRWSEKNGKTTLHQVRNILLGKMNIPLRIDFLIRNKEFVWGIAASSRKAFSLWRGALRDHAKNGCEGDYL